MFILETSEGAIDQGQGPLLFEEFFGAELERWFEFVAVFGVNCAQRYGGLSRATFLGVVTGVLVGYKMVEPSQQIRAEFTLVWVG